MVKEGLVVECWAKARREQAVDELNARLSLSGQLLIEKKVLLP